MDRVGVHPDVPDGLLPYVVLLSVFMLTNFSIVLCGALHATSEAIMSGTIIVTNMAITLFMFLLGGLGDINQHMWGPRPVWNSTVWTVFTAELVTLAVALAIPHLVAARRRDFL